MTPYDMQTASSRVWTQVAVSIPYDSNHYTENASTIYWCVCVCVCVSDHNIAKIVQNNKIEQYT